MPIYKPPLADGSTNVMNESSLPELAEADFFSQVFRVTPDKAAIVIDELLERAAGLGISVSRYSAAISIPDKHLASSASGDESNAASDSSHARTASTESKCSTSTTLTSPNSDRAPHDPPQQTLITFSHYDKYLAQLNPSLDHSKLASSPPPTERHNSTPSLFSVSTRKSYLGIRNGIFKLRRMRKSSPFPDVIVKSVLL